MEGEDGARREKKRAGEIKSGYPQEGIGESQKGNQVKKASKAGQKMISDWVKGLPWRVIHEKSEKHHIEPEFLAALIQTESAGNRFAIRFEARKFMNEAGGVIFHSLWRYFLSPDIYAEKIHSSSPTEWMGQSTAWGPCQVQGTVAREWGFKGWFPELCEWDTGIEYGCKHIKSKMERHGTDPAKIYAAYNAGSPRFTPGGLYVNQTAVDRFMKFYRELTALK